MHPLHRPLLVLLLTLALFAVADARADESDEIQLLIRNGEITEAELRSRAQLLSNEEQFGAESREAAAARDLLVECLYKSPAATDSTTFELALSTVELKKQLYGNLSYEVAKSLYHVAILYDIAEGSLVSRPYFEEVVAILDAAPYLPSTLHARAQYSLGQNLARLGELAAALESYETARALYVELEGPQAPRVADTLAATGKLYLSMGQPEDAEDVFREALSIRDAILGPEDPLSCELHTNLAACSYYMGDLEQAGDRQREALDCLRKTLPEDDPRILHGLKNLAWLESEYGNYAAADSAYLRILKIQEERDGTGDPKTLELYRIYGAHLYLSGAYSDALIWVQKATDGLRTALGARAPQTDSAISTLAEIHRVLGNYEEARRLYQESAENLEESGTSQPSLAMRYNGLGLVALDLGDAAAAKSWFEQALALSREYEGEDHYHTARAYANLGDATALAGDAALALEYYATAMRIFETELGPESPDTVQSAVLLGRVLAEHGDLEQAAEVLEQSYVALIAQEQPSYLGMNRHELARVRLLQDRFEDAALLEDEAIEQLTLAHGAESHPVALSLIVRGWARAGLEQWDAAFADAARAEEIGIALTTDLIPWLPERTAMVWAQRRPQGLSLMWEAARHGGDETQILIAWNGLVRSRAWTLDELGRRARVAAAVTDEETQQIIDDYRRSRERLANAVLDGQSSPGTLETAQRERDLAERRLTEALASELAASPTNAAELPARIPEDVTLLSYLQVRDWRGTPAHYIALVQTAGQPVPTLFDLGDAASLDRLMAEWGASIREGALAVGPMAQASIVDTREVGARVRQRVWDPLADMVAAKPRVLIVPDGSLHGLAFEALPIGDEAWLLDEDLVLANLSAERDLLAPPHSLFEMEESLLCVGNPAFDDNAAPMLVMAETSVFRGAPANCSEFELLEFVPLPHTAREVDEVSALWNAGPPTELSGPDAEEDAVKLAAQSHSNLHLATHAFYLGGDCGGTASDPEGLAHEQALQENPLLLSGLALTGANRREGNGSQGILTAEEVAALDLSGVQLAVLSACETGNGVEVAGEGVLGLRRAFHLAGAEVLVTSLWPVQDEATADWMDAFYTAMWREGQDPAQAARSASLIAREEREAAGLSVHPAHWAAFVVAR